MTLSEWCLQISKEVGDIASVNLIHLIMETAIRVGLEELSANPVDAEIEILGVGRFFLTRYKRRIMGKRDEPITYAPRWNLQFKPSIKIKQVINNKMPMTDLMVGLHYIYPEYHEGKENRITKLEDKDKRHTDQYWFNKIEQLQTGELAIVDKTTFEKRGRPRKKRTHEYVRRKILEEMRRDLRRELRWERQGKITKDEWRMAKW